MASWGQPNQHWNLNNSDGQATFGQPEERTWGQRAPVPSEDSKEQTWGAPSRSGGWGSQAAPQEADQSGSWQSNRSRGSAPRGGRGGYQSQSWQPESQSSTPQEQEWGQQRDFGDRRGGRGGRGGNRGPRSRDQYQDNYDRPQNSYGGYDQRNQYNDQYQRPTQNQGYNQSYNQGYRGYNENSYVNYRDRFPTISEDQFNLIKQSLGKHAAELIEDRLKIQVIMDEKESADMAKYSQQTYKDIITTPLSYYTPNLGPRPEQREQSYEYSTPGNVSENTGYNEAAFKRFQEPPQQYQSTPQPAQPMNTPQPGQPMNTPQPAQPMTTQTPGQSSQTSADFASQYRNLVTQHQHVQEQNRKLEEELLALRASFNCDFCQETPKEMVTGCGHGFCVMCYSEPACIICQTPNSGRPITIKY